MFFISFCILSHTLFRLWSNSNMYKFYVVIFYEELVFKWCFLCKASLSVCIRECAHNLTHCTPREHNVSANDQLYPWGTWDLKLVWGKGNFVVLPISWFPWVGSQFGYPEFISTAQNIISELIMRWSLFVEYFGMDLIYLKRNLNQATDTLVHLQSSDYM